MDNHSLAASVAAHLNLLKCPVDELPETLYRVQYKNTQTDFITTGNDPGEYYLRAKNGTAFQDEVTFNLEHFKTSVIENINWKRRAPSPFINLFSNLHHAGNWCLQKVTKRRQEAMIMFIDPMKLVKQGVWLAKLSTVCKHLAIDMKASKACGDKDAYLVLHEVPATAILDWNLVSDINTHHDVSSQEKVNRGMKGSLMTIEAYVTNTANKEVAHSIIGQDDSRLQLDQVTDMNSTEDLCTVLPDEPSDDYMSDVIGDDGSDQDEEMSITEYSEEDESNDDTSDNGSDAEDRGHGGTMEDDDSDTSTDAHMSDVGRARGGDNWNSASMAYPDSDSDLESEAGEDAEAEADLLDVIAFMREKGLSALE